MNKEHCLMNIYSGALAQRITLGKNLVIHASKKFWLRQNRPYVRPPIHLSWDEI